MHTYLEKEIALKEQKLSLSLLASLALLMASGPFAIDMYLPTLPTLAREFMVSEASVQLTLTAFMVGMAVGAAGGRHHLRFARPQAFVVGGRWSEPHCVSALRYRPAHLGAGSRSTLTWFWFGGMCGARSRNRSRPGLWQRRCKGIHCDDGDPKAWLP